MVKRSQTELDGNIYRIPPFNYVHILDHATNVARTLSGPTTFVRQDNEEVVEGPEKMVMIPPNHYCVIRHPVVKDTQHKLVHEPSGQVKLRHGALEIRLSGEPFPLYPGERLDVKVTKLQGVPRDQALRLQATEDFMEGNVQRLALDEWLFVGPGTYIPRIEVEVTEQIVATIIKPNNALQIRAKRDCKDYKGQDRVCGECWIVDQVGAYLPGAYEEIYNRVTACLLNEKVAIHLEAQQTFKDRFGKVRKSGEKWLVTKNDAAVFIPDIHEKICQKLDVTVINNRQYCVILDPVGEDGKNKLGQRKLIKGEKSFFLHPGEELQNGIQDIYILLEDEALICRSLISFTDQDIKRNPGDKWMVRGPGEFCPTIETEVMSRRKSIPLDVNEGIYVRNQKTGKVRAVIGETYILTQDELLYSKELPTQIEKLLAEAQNPYVGREVLRGSKPAAVEAKARDKTRVISYQVPHNNAVQVFDYKSRVSRVVFGPDLVLLAPDEHFTQLNLSGGQPKKPNVVRTLGLSLGPDFMTDIITVETSDHARLSLTLCYNWYFDVPNPASPTFEGDSARLFAVPDFVGDACKAIASRVRGAVAGVSFDDFHKNSSRIIAYALFRDSESYLFAANRLHITGVDIQSVEPVDQRTRDSLQKSVQMAIEITTNSQEATARHEAERMDQVARGRLERQKLTDEAEAEKSRKALLELQATSAAVESTGQATAEAASRSEALRIEGESAVEQARLCATATDIEAGSELSRIRAAQNSELEYVAQTYILEVDRERELAGIEVCRFQSMIDKLGAQNVAKISTSNRDNQVKLLQALGLKSTLITDGNTPLNLFNTAKGFLGTGSTK